MTTMYHQLNIISPSSQSDSKALFAHHLNSNSSKLFVIWKNPCSLGIEPTTFCAADAMLYHWATGTIHYRDR